MEEEEEEEEEGEEEEENNEEEEEEQEEEEEEEEQQSETEEEEEEVKEQVQAKSKFSQSTKSVVGKQIIPSLPNKNCHQQIVTMRRSVIPMAVPH
eukprot:gnl/Chilomastix_caulleri/2650.p2 GENE.gnl/Chilomastix_caulleri/2650~~gnl/Chilomastix_caulleri/2650.p2  ORF type:complete len:95 (+),score=51.54 gnl/Chilomastix_caulleri/2650:102-386(+)